MKQKIEIELDIPEGYEFDQVLGNSYIAIRKKKPETRWFRAYKTKGAITGTITIDSYSTPETEEQKIACEKDAESIAAFSGWITPWTEYEI